MVLPYRVCFKYVASVRRISKRVRVDFERLVLIAQRAFHTTEAGGRRDKMITAYIPAPVGMVLLLLLLLLCGCVIPLVGVAPLTPSLQMINR